MPPEWGYTDENQIGDIRGAALPMGFNRQPHYSRGVLLLGDAGGMVNPFNGEGISYAMEAAKLAADVIDEATAATVVPAEAQPCLQDDGADTVDYSAAAAGESGSPVRCGTSPNGSILTRSRAPTRARIRGGSVSLPEPVNDVNL